MYFPSIVLDPLTKCIGILQFRIYYIMEGGPKTLRAMLLKHLPRVPGSTTWDKILNVSFRVKEFNIFLLLSCHHNYNYASLFCILHI